MLWGNERKISRRVYSSSGKQGSKVFHDDENDDESDLNFLSTSGAGHAMYGSRPTRILTAITDYVYRHTSEQAYDTMRRRRKLGITTLLQSTDSVVNVIYVPDGLSFVRILRLVPLVLIEL